MSDAESWSHVQEKYLVIPTVNNVAPRNKISIETYNAIEKIKGKHPKLEGLYTRRNGERL